MALTDILFGQSPRDVELPAEIADPMEQRRRALRRITAVAEGREVSPAVEQLEAAGRRGAADIGRAARRQVAAARGPGQLLAARQAGAQASEARARLAGDVAQATGQLTAEEQARARQLQMQGLSQQEAAALRAEELRKRLASPGVLDVLGTVGGTALGGAVGEQQGAQLGGALGQALGQAFERRR